MAGICESESFFLKISRHVALAVLMQPNVSVDAAARFKAPSAAPS
jgi:hypothetical protein